MQIFFTCILFYIFFLRVSKRFNNICNSLVVFGYFDNNSLSSSRNFIASSILLLFNNSSVCANVFLKRIIPHLMYRFVPIFLFYEYRPQYYFPYKLPTPYISILSLQEHDASSSPLLQILTLY